LSLRPPRTPPAISSSSGNGIPELQLVVAGFLDVAGHREDGHATRALHTEICEPLRAFAQDRRDRRDALGVVDRGRRAVQAIGGGERRLEARLALLALERLEQRSFFAADVRAGADERVDVLIDTGALDVLAEQARRVRFFQRCFEARNRFVHELAADVVVRHGSADCVALDRKTLDKRVRVVAQDVAVVTGAGLALVGVANQVLLHRRRARHEAHLHTRRKACAAAAADPSLLDLVDESLRA